MMRRSQTCQDHGWRGVDRYLPWCRQHVQRPWGMNEFGLFMG